LTRENLDYIYDHLGSDIKEKVMLHNTYHVPIEKEHQEMALKIVNDFIRKIE
jgi:hypothetical protein